MAGTLANLMTATWAGILFFWITDILTAWSQCVQPKWFVHTSILTKIDNNLILKTLYIDENQQLRAHIPAIVNCWRPAPPPQPHQRKDPVVARVAGEDVSLSGTNLSVLSLRRPSLKPDLPPEEEIRELRAFLPLYTDYLAKLAEAKSAGYFEMPEILDETGFV